MKKTEKGTKKFSKEEKLRIIEEARTKGVKLTLSKYGLYPATFYYWKKKLLVHGTEGLDHQTLKQREKQVRKLEKENEMLKLMLAEKELEGRIKDELIKKKYPEMRRKNL